MSKRTKFLATVSVMVSLATSSVSQDATAETVVATVNGTDITLGHIIVLQDSLPEQYQSLPDDVLFSGLLDQLIQQSVLAGQAGEPSAIITLRLENERRTLLAGSAIQAVIDSELTEEAYQAAYEARFAGAEPTNEFNASHILVESEEEAKALVVELDGGADFAELAIAKSTGPSGPNGGELGWFGPGMMVKPFEDVVTEMETGQISAPVKTQFGWHVIKLNEARIKETPTLDSVRSELTEEIQQRVIEQTLADLTANADVSRPDVSELDPAIIRDLGLVIQ